ncbi:MAG: kappa-carrageenase [Verrucomicrobiota bacterium]
MKPNRPLPVALLLAALLFGWMPDKQTSGEEISPPSKDAFHTLTDTSGRSIEARILHVDEVTAFIRRENGGDFELQLEMLDPSSRQLVAQWQTNYAHLTTETQLAYLRSLSEPPETVEEESTVDQNVDTPQTTVDGDPLPYLDNPDPTANWRLVDDFSDEFEGGYIDERKWFRFMRPWGERAWTPDNVWQEDGTLKIQAVYEPHTDSQGREFFYKLGILQSQTKTTYGYFEARIKGCSRFPGLCPAFWLYSNRGETNPDYPDVTYSEIDIVELQQGLYNPGLKRRVDVNYIDLNLHARIMEDGEEIWLRPNGVPELCRGGWEAPWDPRDDFHVYAVENTPEKITWYIDGEKMAEKENHYWHLPMNITLTMELRPPLIAWAGDGKRLPVPEAATPDGFPTHMEVDYVRTWVRDE